MKKKLFTLDDLYEFFVKQNKDYSFDSKQSDYVISVQVPAIFTITNESNQGLLPVHMRVCHTKLNRNGSYISDENMQKALTTLYNKPILGHIIENEDGVADFHAHDVEFDDDGNIFYIERPVGIFPESCSPQLVYDKDMDKTYVEADGFIYEEYGNQAADIMSRDGSKKMSCELAVEGLSYNAKEKYLELIDFYFNGATILGSDPETGEEIGEGMLGSNISLKDFSLNQGTGTNSSDPQQNYSAALAELKNAVTVLNEINKTLKGGEKLTKFEELLKQYNVANEDVTFEYEGLSDEELEAKFAETFGEADETPDSSDDDSSDSDETETFNKQVKKISALESGDMEITFAISHEDIRTALYGLLSTVEDLDNDWYWISSVYDDHFAYENWSGGKIWGQKYSIDGDNVKFEGERYELHRELLTTSELAELESMRANYAVLQEKVNKFENDKLHQERMDVLNRVDYSILYNMESFKELEKHIDEYSTDELETKLDAMVGKFAIQTKTFSKTPNKQRTNRIGLLGNDDSSDSYPFKSLFTKDELKK